MAKTESVQEGRCPSCTTVLGYPQHFCVRCGRWLQVPGADSQAIPPPPLFGRPPRVCQRCGCPAGADSTFCPNCGARLGPEPPAPARAKRPRKEYEWLPYVMFPLMIIVQIGLLVLLWVVSGSGWASPFVLFILVAGVGNVIAGVGVIRSLLRLRAAKP